MRVYVTVIVKSVVIYNSIGEYLEMWHMRFHDVIKSDQTMIGQV